MEKTGIYKSPLWWSLCVFSWAVNRL